jgi:nitrous oxidase accessory protein
LLAYNEIGISMLPLVQRNTFTRNIFQDNAEQVSIVGTGNLNANAWSDGKQGNYWSDYRGFDAQGDAVGDLPYEAQSLYEDLLAGYPELRIFHASPAVAAIDLAARAFPIFQPQAKLTDPQPLTVAPSLPPVEGLEQQSFAAGLAVATGMLLLATLLLALGLHTERVPR